MNLLVVVPLVVVVFVAACLLFAWRMHAGRRAVFQKVGRRLGLSYAKGRYRDTTALYGYPQHVLEGTFEGRPVKVFEAMRRKQASIYFVLKHGRNMPRLQIFPENWTAKLSKGLGGIKDISFGGDAVSQEFSRTFVVQCDDERFARAVCHQRTMQYMLGHLDMPSVVIEGDQVMLWWDYRTHGVLKGQNVEPQLRLLIEVFNVIFGRVQEGPPPLPTTV